VFTEEFANIKGHFGPINSLCYHPDGNTFITGAEDGYVRINTFDEEFKNFEFDS
jgi:translation initiation factor 3 subunit I